jgi:hypothetical protein
MGVILGVASEAVLGCALVHAVDVAIAAFHSGVLTFQWESGLGVVEGRGLPILWRVAGGAVLPELPLVGVIIGVAGGAILGCSL